METLRLRNLGRRDYRVVWQAMQSFTAEREAASPDEIWLVEHPPVFTLGRNSKTRYPRDTGDIPVVQCDRGGQATYHGPGQIVIYALIDLRRRALGVRQLVEALELAVIDLLQFYRLTGESRAEAPGVYVRGKKLASLGLRVRGGCTYHGLSLNVAMDLSPFQRIDPCGYAGMEMIDLRRLGLDLPLPAAGRLLAGYLQQRLKYTALV